MGAVQNPEPEQRSGSARTLGDVLYAGRTKPLVPESEWLGLVRAIAARDQRALHELYRRTHRIVFTLIVRITHSRETAEELTVDVFHDVWRRAATYDPANGTVVGWLMNQARSRAIDRLRHEQRRKRVDPHPGDLDENTGGPELAFEMRERARVLREALVQLAPQERHAIETAYFAGLTYAEAAARLREPEGTIKTRIRAGLTKLRQALAGKAVA